MNDFSSFYEIFALLNLGYATSRPFREALNNDILSLFNGVNSGLAEKIQELNDKLVVTLSEQQSEKIQNKIQDKKEKFEAACENCIEQEKDKREFVDGFKTMFLITSLFCFVLIIVGGFEQFFIAPWQENLTILIMNLVLFYNGLIFLRSFTKYFKFLVSPWYAITIIGVLVLTSYLMATYCPHAIATGNFFSDKTLAVLSLISAASPYLFHFLKVAIHKLYYRWVIRIWLFKTNRILRKVRSALAGLKAIEEL